MQKRLIALSLLLGLLLHPLELLAATQNLAALEQAARRFVEQELRFRPATFTLGRLDPRLALPACEQPQVSWSAGAVPSGNSSLDLSCPAAGWSLRLPVTIAEKRMGVVATRPLKAGELLAPDDVRLAEMTSPALSRNVLNRLDQAIGQSMRSSVPAGAWLRSFMLQQPDVIRTNQRVKVLAQGDGFVATAEGTARGNAAVGESVRVRMASGREVSGVAQADGSVLVSY
ncbi:flagella basal body P-ring formation protein FlgA [Pseudogulbenkiania sp. NH8B]|uniref:flagellar basal body P-ring formation chaperone FlgA n=1 Tax=Pseudogulbenkiania sp. (strain NH8B) TaxID=748280 RepID=UPI000227A3AA|nr:flagellar basal body P-ring formation chaperone FlgA [Pseudogulbenkiania sp. NH8B]BAK78135.1 flagella basal body P-ring formation protein FlgA [Pseudogulbenkiania sp. NH8B]